MLGDIFINSSFPRLRTELLVFEDSEDGHFRDLFVHSDFEVELLEVEAEAEDGRGERLKDGHSYDPFHLP